MIPVMDNPNDSDDEKNQPDGGGGMPAGRPKIKTIKVYRDTTVTRDVYSWFEITLREVNVVEQYFNCSVEVHCFWQDFSIPAFVNLEKDEEFRLDDDCAPIKLSEVFENKSSFSFDVEPKFSYLEEFGTVYMMFVADVVFTERLELERFPLDRQFLNMKFNAWVKEGNWNWITSYPDWVPEEFHKPFAVRLSSSVTEYNLKSPWVDFSTDQPLNIRLRVERRPEYYMGNIILPNFLIVAGCFADFVMQPSDPGDRLGVTVTLMLAAVAFRFVITSMLPKVSYLTYMDYYILIGFVGLFIFVIENSMAGVGQLSKGVPTIIDKVSGALFAIIWIVLHIIVTVVLYHKEWGRLSWKEMDELDQEEEDEFIYVDKADLKGNGETPSCVDEWNQFRVHSPATRATMFKTNNPDLIAQSEVAIGDPGENVRAQSKPRKSSKMALTSEPPPKIEEKMAVPGKAMERIMTDSDPIENFAERD